MRRQTGFEEGALNNATTAQISMRAMTYENLLQVEYRSGVLTVGEEILQFLGNPVVSILGSLAARQLDLSDNPPGTSM